MKQYVTRKVSGTRTKITYYDRTDGQNHETEILLPRRIPPNRKDIAERDSVNFLKKTNDNRIFLAVLSFYIEESLYGVPFEDFMKIAVPLNDKRKPKMEE